MTSRRSRYQSYLRAIRAMTGATHREAQLTWQRLGPWLDRHDRRSAAAIRRHPRKLAEYLALARGYVPAGWAVEVTLRTLRGGRLHQARYERTEAWTEGRRVRERTRTVTERRMLYLKIVTTAEVALPIAEHESCVRWAIRTGALQDRFRRQGFKLVVMDWEKGKGSGSLQVIADLVSFYGALQHENTEIRADMVAREEEM